LNKRLGGYDVRDFAYGLLTGCNYSMGMVHAKVELVTASDRTKMTQVLKDEAKRIVPLIRTQMATTSSSATPAPAAAPEPPDPAEQLKKLSELREADLLTEEEFQAKRAEVVDRL
jgi:Bacterial PH domain